MERFHPLQHLDWDIQDQYLYNFWLGVIALKKQEAPAWTYQFIRECQHRIAPVQVYQVPCENLSVHSEDPNATRQCAHFMLPCMQYSTQTIFYPLYHHTIFSDDWKLGLLHEFAHMYPPNPSHDTRFFEALYTYCRRMSLPQTFRHIIGFVPSALL